MKPIPDLSDTSAMAARGRRSALMSARNEACQELRDVAVAMQSCDIFTDDIESLCRRGREAINQLSSINTLASVTV